MLATTIPSKNNAYRSHFRFYTVFHQGTGTTVPYLSGKWHTAKTHMGSSRSEVEHPHLPHCSMNGYGIKEIYKHEIENDRQYT